jgi:hypothetical protein
LASNFASRVGVTTSRSPLITSTGQRIRSQSSWIGSGLIITSPPSVAMSVSASVSSPHSTALSIWRVECASGAQRSIHHSTKPR